MYIIMYFWYYIMNTVKFETFKVEKFKYLKRIDIIRYFIVKFRTMSAMLFWDYFYTHQNWIHVRYDLDFAGNKASCLFVGEFTLCNILTQVYIVKEKKSCFGEHTLWI